MSSFMELVVLNRNVLYELGKNNLLLVVGCIQCNSDPYRPGLQQTCIMKTLSASSVSVR